MDERIDFNDINDIVKGRPILERNVNIRINMLEDKLHRQAEPSPPPHHSHDKKIRFDDLIMR